MSDRDEFREYMRDTYHFGGVDGTQLDEDDVDIHYNEYRSLDENISDLNEYIDEVESDDYVGSSRGTGEYRSYEEYLASGGPVDPCSDALWLHDQE